MGSPGRWPGDFQLDVLKASCGWVAKRLKHGAQPSPCGRAETAQQFRGGVATRAMPIIRPLPPCGGGLSALASQGAKRPRRLRRKGEGYPAGHCPIPVATPDRGRGQAPAAPASPETEITGMPSPAQPASTPASLDSQRCTPLPLSLGSASPRQEKEPSPTRGEGANSARCDCPPPQGGRWRLPCDRRQLIESRRSAGATPKP
jgi:hypothetical protein